MSQEPDYIFGVDGKKYVRVRQGEYVLDANDSAQPSDKFAKAWIIKEIQDLRDEINNNFDWDGNNASLPDDIAERVVNVELHAHMYGMGTRVFDGAFTPNLWDRNFLKELVSHPGPQTTAFKPVRDPQQNRQDITGYWYGDHAPDNDPQSSDPLWAPLQPVDEDVRLWNGVDKRGVVWKDGISIGVIGNDGPGPGPNGVADGEPIWDGVDANGILWENGTPIGQVDTDTVKWERAANPVQDADDAEQRTAQWKAMKLQSNKKNRLRGAACYLAGPMSACQDFGESWRNIVTPQLRELGVVVLDPTHKPIEIGREDAAARAEFVKMKEAGDLEGLRQVLKVIRRVDLRCIDLSSFVIVRLDGTDTVGTWEEIAMAVSQRKPTLIWLAGEVKKAHLNPWMLAQTKLEYIFDTWEDLYAYLKTIDESPAHPEDHWWLLFDFEKLYREVLP